MRSDRLLGIILFFKLFGIVGGIFANCTNAAESLLCHQCSCMRSKSEISVTCSATKNLEIIFNTAKAVAGCHKEGKLKLSLETGSSKESVVLPWKLTTSKPRFAGINLTGVSLKCDCRNAWIIQLENLQNSSLRRDSNWEEKFEESLGRNLVVTTPAYILNFPSKILLPYRLEYCLKENGDVSVGEQRFSEFLETYCEIPDLFSEKDNQTLSCSSSLTARSTTAVDSQCGVSLKMILPLLHTLQLLNSSCDQSISFDLTNRNIEESGWAICILDSPYVPKTLITRIVLPGEPKLLRVSTAKRSKSTEIHIKILSGEKLRTSFYLYNSMEEIWQIRPNFDYRFRLKVHYRFADAFLIHHYTLTFADSDLHCTAGQYLMRACNGFNNSACAMVNFQLESSRGRFGSCAKMNHTFQVLRVTSNKPTEPNATMPRTYFKDGDRSSVTENYNPWVYIVFLSVPLVFIICLLIVCIGSWGIKSSRHPQREVPLQIVMDSRSPSAEPPGQQQLRGCRISRNVDKNGGYISWIKAIQQKNKIAVLPREEITPIRQLGEGAFGCVHLVKWSNSPIQLPAKPHKIRRSSSVRRLLFRAYTTASSMTKYTSANLSSSKSPASANTTPLLPRHSREESDPIYMAMKLLKFVTQETLKDLEREASVLTTLKHPNIVQFYGMTVEGSDGFALLFEYMEHGDLVHYLRAHSADLLDPSTDTRPLKYKELLQISLQVASGLEYLCDRHLIHRDLAARNCLVGLNLIVKLSDFGMTRDLYVTDYYRLGAHTLVPLRWLSPESVVYRKFTKESDIWSLGVLLWEVFSHGQVPWYAYSNSEVLELVKEGRILDQPDFCPPEVYESLILGCCKQRPNERISASDAKEILETLLENTLCYCSMRESSSTSASLHSEFCSQE